MDVSFNAGPHSNGDKGFHSHTKVAFLVVWPKLAGKCSAITGIGRFNFEAYDVDVDLSGKVLPNAAKKKARKMKAKMEVGKPRC